MARKMLMRCGVALVAMAMASTGWAAIINPIVFNSQLVMNNTGSVQHYSFTETVPVTAGAPNRIRGSVTTELLDMGNDGGSIAAPSGGAIFNAQIDGVTVRQLQAAPFSLIVPVIPDPTYVNNAQSEFAFEWNTVPVNQSIGITLSFDLSPGDAASVLSQFELLYDESIPEPATLALLGLGGLLMVHRKR